MHLSGILVEIKAGTIDLGLERFNQVQIVANEASDAAIGSGAGIATLRVVVHTAGNLLVRLIRVIHLGIILDLNMQLVHIESVLVIEQAELVEHALEVAARLLLVREFPLLVLLNVFGRDAALLSTLIAGCQQIRLCLHHIVAGVLSTMMMRVLVGQGQRRQRQQQNKNFHDAKRNRRRRCRKTDATAL